MIVTDMNGCVGDGKFNIASQTELISSVISSTDANCVGKKDGSIVVEASGGHPPYNYLWSTGDFTPYVVGLDAGEYIVTITDELGCSITNKQIVNTGTTSDPIIVTSAFSPNGDGINDKWTISNLEKDPENEVVVVNRWGNEVYTQKFYQNTWDGSDLNEGTYFYIIKTNVCNEPVTYKGYVTIVR